jgi:protein gp37
VIVGGESGANARPCDLAWIRSIIQQCRTAAVPVFVKQLGSGSWKGGPNGYRDSKGGDPEEWPGDLRVREFPHGPTVPADGAA